MADPFCCDVCFENYDLDSRRPVLCSASVSCGNSVCERCFEALIQQEEKACPMCRSTLEDQKIRNIALEHLLAQQGQRSTPPKVCPADSEAPANSFLSRIGSKKLSFRSSRRRPSTNRAHHTSDLKGSLRSSGLSATNNGTLNVLGNCIGPDSSGKFFTFRAADLEAIVGEWCSSAMDSASTNFVVKGGEGAVFRAKNPRSGKVGAVVVWGGRRDAGGGEADAFGCWNPADYADAADWQVADSVQLLDFAGGLELYAPAVPVVSLELKTETGWNLDADKIRFGQCGLVGGWWKGLEVQFNLPAPHVVTAVRTDSGPALPFALSFSRDGGATWEQAAAGLRGAPLACLPQPVTAQAFRLAWAETDLHKSEGLSTARSGGGLHAQLLGFSEAAWASHGAADHEVATARRAAEGEAQAAAAAAEEDPAAGGPPVGTAAAPGGAPSGPGRLRVFGVDIGGPGAAGDGRFFRCYASEVAAAAGGPWAAGGMAAGSTNFVVKGGEGAAFRALNPRTGKAGAVLVWGGRRGPRPAGLPAGAAEPDAFGCWNPADYAEPGDWQAGDELVLVGCQEGPGPRTERYGPPVPVAQAEATTETGWGLGADKIGFGQCGLVGGYWKGLEVELLLAGRHRVTGVRTDGGAALPVAVSLSSDGGRTWAALAAGQGLAPGLDGVAALPGPPAEADAVRLAWAETDLHKTGGLSTARSGGGLHAEVLGFSEAAWAERLARGGRGTPLLAPLPVGGGGGGPRPPRKDGGAEDTREATPTPRDNSGAPLRQNKSARGSLGAAGRAGSSQDRRVIYYPQKDGGEAPSDKAVYYPQKKPSGGAGKPSSTSAGGEFGAFSSRQSSMISEDDGIGDLGAPWTAPPPIAEHPLGMSLGTTLGQTGTGNYQTGNTQVPPLDIDKAKAVQRRINGQVGVGHKGCCVVQ